MLKNYMARHQEAMKRNQRAVPTQIQSQANGRTPQQAQSTKSEYVETKIAGETLKVTKFTEDYLRRFEGFLNHTPEHKVKFLKDKFFNRLPKSNGIFGKSQRKKSVKCAICLKTLAHESELRAHLQSKHSELVELGIEMVNGGEYKISNKVVNLISIFCFTNPHDIKTIMDIVEENKYSLGPFAED